jgi:uncharacterized protein YjbI with pentapeptide repeats
MRNADLTNVNFAASNMNGADLSRAILDGANFTQAMIRDSMWIMTDMKNANFDKASLHRSDLSMAKYDDSTRFPNGFNPLDTGWKDVTDA